MKKLGILLPLLILGILFSTSCKKKGTQWNSDWVVPLIKDSLTINDYVNDSTLAVNSDQSIQVVLDRNLLDFDLADLVKIPDTTINQSFNINVNSLTIPPGYSFIDDVKENEFSFGDAVMLEARIKSGKVKIRVENPISTVAIFTVSLPGVEKNGVTFTHTQAVDGGTPSNPGVGVLEFNFAGYTLNLRGKDGDMYNILQSKLNVKSDPEGPEVTLTSQDQFNTNVSFEGLKVDYGKGYFGQLTFSDTTEVKIDLLNKIVGGAVNIDEINLDLSIRNGIKAAGQGNINLFESENYAQNSVGLTHPYFGQYLNLNPASGAWDYLTPSELNFTFNESSGNLKEFLENLGSTYRIGYTININPFGNTSSGNNVVYPNSKIGINLKANFPLKVGMNDLVLLDTFKIDFKNDGKLLRIREGKLVLNAKNSFPYGAAVELSLLNEDEELVKVLQTEGKITPAPVNESLNGHIPVEEKMIFFIDEEIAEYLAETEFIVVKATFNSTTFTNNVVYVSDKLEFLLQGYFTLKAEL